MKRTNFLMIALASGMILTACAAPAPAPAATTAPAATAASVATEAPAATEAPVATEAPAATEAPTVAATEAATAAATEVMTATAATTATETTASAAGAMTYVIDNTRSQVSFTLNEKLMGNPTTVVGATPKVNGQIMIDWANPANTKVGKIEIDATDFKTDNERRNGAIQRFILQTDQFPMVTFEPTAIEGLPASVKAGDALTFKITGNLTVRNITAPVTFDVTANARSETEIEGTAKANTTRTAFQLTIPSVPSVADVTDEVALEIKFVAAKQ